MPRNLIAFAVYSSMWLAATGAASSAHAATIMKLNLGADAADDIHLDNGQFSTIDDGTPHTDGYQNTSVEFTDFLDSFADIASPQASFTLAGLTPTGDSMTFSGWLVEQDFVEGSLSLFAPDNTLLLSANMTISAVTGPLGAPGEEGLFLGLGEVTGGLIARRLDRNSLSVRMKLPTINAGGGFAVSPPPPVYPAPDQYAAPLTPFAAGATVEIRAVEVPEPASFALLMIASALVGINVRRRRYTSD